MPIKCILRAESFIEKELINKEHVLENNTFSFADFSENSFTLIKHLLLSLY